MALSFTKRGGYLTVIVRNPVADTRTYQAELAAHGIHIYLRLIPGSPSVVGAIVQMTVGGRIKIITARGACSSGYRRGICPVGFRVPLSFHGGGFIYFARAARPGEQYVVSGSPYAAGEALSGLRPSQIAGQRVAVVLSLLRRRHVRVARYSDECRSSASTPVRAGQVPGGWYVYDAGPVAPEQVVLGVGPTRTPMTLRRSAGVWRTCGQPPAASSRR